MSRNRFSEYQQAVNERRQRHNLEGNADLRPERIQQSGMDDWMEYQNNHLHTLERLEVAFEKAKEVLDATKKELDKAGDPGFGKAYKQSKSDSSKDFWHKLWGLNLNEYEDAQKERQLAERELGLLMDPSKAAKLDSSKEIPQRAQKEVASAMRRLERAKKSENQYRLRDKVCSAAKSFSSIKNDLKLNKILVNWIQQQYPVIAARHASSFHNTEGNNNQGLITKSSATKRTLSPQPRSSISRKRNQSAGTSITDPNVRKRRRSKRIASLKEENPIQARKNHPLDRPGLLLSSKTTRNRKKIPSSFTRSTTTSRRTNPQQQQSTTTTNHRLRNNRKKNDGAAANREPAAKVPLLLLRRSTRLSKEPERFCPG